MILHEVSVYDKGLGVKRLTGVFVYIIWDIFFEMKEETLTAHNNQLYQMVVNGLINPENTDLDFTNWEDNDVLHALEHLPETFGYDGSSDDLLQALQQRYANRISIWLNLEEPLTIDRVKNLVLHVVRLFLERNRKFL